MGSRRQKALRACILIAGLVMMAACRNDQAPQAPLTRVKAVTAEIVDYAPSIVLTGVIAARTQTELSFRVSGKISERLVNVGDHVIKGQVLARLDPDEQEADLAAAKAGVASGDAALRQMAAAFERQKELLTRGNTTRRDYDQAEAALRSAQAQLDQAHADLQQAEDQVSYTQLKSDADGIITARSAEVGQVVAQAQPVYTLAHDGPRDAIFNVHEWVLNNGTSDKDLTISLLINPSVTTVGDVREISPAVNPATETVSVKVGLRSTPHEMTLGALVNGTGPLRTEKVVLLPWAALFDVGGKPAVWTIDPTSNMVSTKPIVIYRYTKDRIAVLSGLQAGEVVVSAGVQLLRPNQKVEIAAEPKR